MNARFDGDHLRIKIALNLDPKNQVPIETCISDQASLLQHNIGSTLRTLGTADPPVSLCPRDVFQGPHPRRIDPA